MTIYGVYQPFDDDEAGQGEVLLEQFTSEQDAEAYVLAYPYLAYSASSDEEGWIVRFWEQARDETVAEYSAAAAGRLGAVPAYANKPFGNQTAEERVADWRKRNIADAQGRIAEANNIVGRAKAAATRARNTGPDKWIARHFPNGSELTVRPIEVRDRPIAYGDIRYDPDVESYLRGHNEG